MNKKKLIITIFILMGMSLVFYNITTHARSIFYRKCSPVVPLSVFSPISMHNCKGIISIEIGMMDNYYSVYDHMHSYEVGQVTEPDKINYVNNKMYFVSTQNEYDWYGIKDGKKGYLKKFYKNSHIEDNEYYNFDDIPTYLIVDTQTGRVQTFLSLDQVPVEERGYFIK